jgi:hypothetical protein
MHSASYTRLVCVSALVLYFLLGVAFIALSFTELGTFSTIYWLFGFVLSLVFKAVVVETTYLYLLYGLGSYLVRDEVIKYRNALHFRGRSFLRRQQGFKPYRIHIHIIPESYNEHTIS